MTGLKKLMMILWILILSGCACGDKIIVDLKKPNVMQCGFLIDFFDEGLRCGYTNSGERFDISYDHFIQKVKSEGGFYVPTSEFGKIKIFFKDACDRMKACVPDMSKEGLFPLLRS